MWLARHERGKRPRDFAGTRAANLVGSGFPPAGLLGVSSRRLEDDARYEKVFLRRARTYRSGHSRLLEVARLMLQGTSKAMVIRRRRVKHEIALEARLLLRAQEARDAARRLPPGRQRELPLRQARASEMAVQIDKWVSSPGLRPPK